MTPGQEQSLRILIRDPDTAISGKGIDMRCGRGLVELGYWTPGEPVHIDGYHALGLFKHLPTVPRVSRETFKAYAGAYLTLIEDHTLQPLQGSDENPEPPLDLDWKTFEFSCKKLLTFYDRWCLRTNEHIAAGWSLEWDHDIEQGWKESERVTFIRSQSWRQALTEDEDFSYTHRTVAELAEAIIGAQEAVSKVSYLGSCGHKGSFDDTDWEAELLKRGETDTRCIGEFKMEVGH